MRAVLAGASVVLLLNAGGCCLDDPGPAKKAGPEAKANPAAAAPAEASTVAAPVKRLVEIRPAGGAAGPEVSSARYVTRFRDPLIEEIRERDEAWKKSEGEKTSKIHERQEAEKEKKRLEKLRLVSSLPADQIPSSLAAFSPVAHRPPVPQHYTGTCWSFAATSLLESEVERITGTQVKLSEMGFVYHEYLAKARRVLAERGDSQFGQGSEANAVMRMAERYGAWPLSAYPGVTAEDGRHDHIRLEREMKAMLQSFESSDMWDEDSGLAMLRVLLDRHLGRPPERFEVAGRSLDPRTYLREVLKIDPTAYVGFVSTLKFPFYTKAEFEVPDNWWHSKDYHNLPLAEFYTALKGAIRAGYSLVIAVDVSEPGKDGPDDTMFVPAYDIPPDRIDQLARELRMENGATTDDHGVHLIGYAEHAGHDWFLVKDSGRSARRGKHKGYYFVRDDYIKLKVLAFTVHRDAVAAALSKFAD